MLRRHAVHEEACSRTVQTPRNLCHHHMPRCSLHAAQLPLKPCPDFSPGAIQTFSFSVLVPLRTSLINLCSCLNFLVVISDFHPGRSQEPRVPVTHVHSTKYLHGFLDSQEYVKHFKTPCARNSLGIPFKVFGQLVACPTVIAASRLLKY